MTTEWKWNGARWWKADLHAHTPASEDYGKGHDQDILRNRTAKEWLLDYMRAKIDCVAITDHNSGEWVDSLKTALEEMEEEKPDGFRPVWLFPGVEISVNGGAHLLAIFGSDKTTADITSLLGAVGMKGERGSSDSVTSRSLSDVVEAVVSADGIPIPAHADKESGLFRETGGNTLKQVLECEDVFAVELMDPEYEKPQLYHAENPCWTEIIGSDSHHPSGKEGNRYPGSHFTWVKMGIPGIEGLRLALLDGRLSVRRSDSQETDDPNKHPSLALESIEVSDARYLGRSTPFTMKFNPRLNSLIGGRGTGKSTIVEFLRIVLRRQDELPVALKTEFEQYSKAYRNREDSGLLTEETKIRVIYRKNGFPFRIQWNYAGTLDSIEQQVEGEWRRAEGQVRQRFPVRICSQKQIFQMAKTPLALLRVIDEVSEIDRHSWVREWKEKSAQFLSLRAETRKLEAGLAEESLLRGELADVKHRLTDFEKSGYADVLQSFQKRSRQRQSLEAWEENWAYAGKRLREVADKIVPGPLDRADFNPESEPDAELSKNADKVSGSMNELRESVKLIALKADEVLADWRENMDKSSWKRSVEGAERQYEELKKDMEREKGEGLSDYGQSVRRRQEIEDLLLELKEREKQARELKRKADECLRQMVEIRRNLTESRKRFLERVLSQNRYVSIRVVPYGARETVETELRELLQRETGFEKDIGGLIEKLYLAAESGEDVERNLADVKDSIRRLASDRDGSEPTTDKRFATHLSKLAPEAMDRLDLWFPEDSLDVRYSATGDGKDLKSIQEGSPGQKTAAILAFLLSYGEEPLIMDQPEDDLDNRLIYDLIVTQLRAAKLHRQVIVVTHNANMVVNGDAELIVTLKARGGQTWEECCGCLQQKEVRNTICAVMEGGKEAFENRYRRLALERRDG